MSNNFYSDQQIMDWEMEGKYFNWRLSQLLRIQAAEARRDEAEERRRIQMKAWSLQRNPLPDERAG